MWYLDILIFNVPSILLYFLQPLIISVTSSIGNTFYWWDSSRKYSLLQLEPSLGKNPYLKIFRISVSSVSDILLQALPLRSFITRLLKLAEDDCLSMRNIKTFVLFVFLAFLGRTGGEETEEEDILEDGEARERRGLYGGGKEELCPDQCLCLSEIQVR